jgi:predicted nuclease of predicted toxin-antitoxin system
VKFLIDECLSPILVDEARLAGFEAYHVAHIGRASWNDWDLVAHAVAQDLILVTNNAADFRALYAREELHSGLVIILPNVDRQTQLQLFQFALTVLPEAPDLVNKVLEIRLHSGAGDAELYDWPDAPS